MPASKYSVAQKRNAIAEWAKTTMSAKDFAVKNGIPRSTFLAWTHDPYLNRTDRMPIVGGANALKVTPEVEQEIIRLRKEKYTYACIGSKLGLSDASVGAVCRKYPELDCYHKGGAIAKTIDIPEPDPKDEAIIEAFNTPFEQLAEAYKEAVAAEALAKTFHTPFEQLAEAYKEVSAMPENKSVIKLSTIQVKGETTGFRYNVGERLMINNNWNIELDQLNDFIAELNQVAKLVQAVRE